MNFFSNIPSDNLYHEPFLNNYHPEVIPNIFYKINELEERIKKLDERINRLEHDNDDSLILDNSLYML